MYEYEDFEEETEENESDSFSVIDYGRDFTMFHIESAPENPDYQDLVQKYLDSDKKNKQYLEWILSAYEEKINEIALANTYKYNMPSHFADMKMSVAQGIIEALNHYDFSFGKSFMQFKNYYVDNEILRYVRTMQTGYTIPSNKKYSFLRKVMAIYFDMGQKNDDETIGKIADLMMPKEENREKAKRSITDIIQAGLRNMHCVQFDRSEFDDEDVETASDICFDESSDTYYRYLFLLRHKAVWNAFYSLSEKEQDMIADSIGFCPKCRKTFKLAKDKDGDKAYVKIKPMPYTVLAEKYQVYDPNTIKKHLKKAYREMFEYMKRTDYLANLPDDDLKQLEIEAAELQKKFDLPPEKMRPFYAHLWEEQTTDIKK